MFVMMINLCSFSRKTTKLHHPQRRSVGQWGLRRGYSCFDKTCPTKAQKHTRQCRLVLWVVIILRCLNEFHGGSSKMEGEIINTRVCLASFYTMKHLKLQSWNRKIPITHNLFRHCRVRFSSFVRQPFSKQLYIGQIGVWVVRLGIYARRTRTNFGVIDLTFQDSEMFNLVAFLLPSDYAKKTLGLGNNSDVITCNVS